MLAKIPKNIGQESIIDTSETEHIRSLATKKNTFLRKN